MSRILVAYGSKHGATAEIAEQIGATLSDAGHEVSIKAAGEVGEVEPYEAVVLGSAVYQGRWRREARGLLRRLRRDLAERPLWLFSSGPLGDDELDPDDRWQHPKGVRRTGQRLGARGQVVFGGRLPERPANFMERALVKNTPEGKGDARDFKAIAAWAEGIAADLRSGRARAAAV